MVGGQKENQKLVLDMPIRKTKGGYKIQNVKGTSKTKGEAEKRLRAIKAAQARRKK